MKITKIDNRHMNINDQKLFTTYSHFDIEGGGKATVIVLEDKQKVYYGISFCSPKDMFSRKTGRTNAEKRLFVHLRRSENGLTHSKLAGTFDVKSKQSLSDLYNFCKKAVNKSLAKDAPHWASGMVDFRNNNV